MGLRSQNFGPVIGDQDREVAKIQGECTELQRKLQAEIDSKASLQKRMSELESKAALVSADERVRELEARVAEQDKRFGVIKERVDADRKAIVAKAQQKIQELEIKLHDAENSRGALEQRARDAEKRLAEFKTREVIGVADADVETGALRHQLNACSSEILLLKAQVAEGDRRTQEERAKAEADRKALVDASRMLTSTRLVLNTTEQRAMEAEKQVLELGKRLQEMERGIPPKTPSTRSIQTFPKHSDAEGGSIDAPRPTTPTHSGTQPPSPASVGSVGSTASAPSRVRCVSLELL